MDAPMAIQTPFAPGNAFLCRRHGDALATRLGVAGAYVHQASAVNTRRTVAAIIRL
jgi:hypothetical protein